MLGTFKGLSCQFEFPRAACLESLSQPPFPRRGQRAGFGGCGSSVFLGVEGVPPSAMDSPSLSRYRWSLFTIWSTNHTLTYLMGPVDSTGPAMLMEAEGRAWKSPTYQIPGWCASALSINQQLQNATNTLI